MVCRSYSKDGRLKSGKDTACQYEGRNPSEIEFGISKARVAPNNPQIASQEEERHLMLGFLLRIKESLPGGLAGLVALFCSHRTGAERVVLSGCIFDPFSHAVYAYSPYSSHCINPLFSYQGRSVAGLSYTPSHILSVFPTRPDFSRAFSYPEK
jgi:hypothetical protein